MSSAVSEPTRCTSFAALSSLGKSSSTVRGAADGDGRLGVGCTPDRSGAGVGCASARAGDLVFFVLSSFRPSHALVRTGGRGLQRPSRLRAALRGGGGGGGGGLLGLLGLRGVSVAPAGRCPLACRPRALRARHCGARRRPALSSTAYAASSSCRGDTAVQRQERAAHRTSCVGGGGKRDIPSCHLDARVRTLSTKDQFRPPRPRASLSSASRARPSLVKCASFVTSSCSVRAFAWLLHARPAARYSLESRALEKLPSARRLGHAISSLTGAALIGALFDAK